MAGIQIVTDSTADLPQDVAQEHDIRIVPLSVSFGDEHYVDGVDLTPAEFYGKLRSNPVLPRTSQPPPGRFAEVYREALDAGRQVLSIHISSKLSGTIRRLAAEMVDPENIVVMDSLTVSMGVGLMALAAAQHNGTLTKPAP